MNIKELSLDEFKLFAETHFIGNFYQSISYALLKAEEGFEYEFIGYGGDEIIGAALILYKKIGSYYYGYSPRGFLIDYSNLAILKDFTEKIKVYYGSRNFAFIKINPEIAIAKLNKNTKEFEYNENNQIINNLKNNGYIKLKDNMNFEAMLPRVNAIVNLQNFNHHILNKNTRNKVKKGIKKGLKLELVDQNKIGTFYEFIKENARNDEYHYNALYNVFTKNNSIDFFLVKIDYREFLINAQNNYAYEQNINNDLNNKLIDNNNSNIINSKMNSDKALLSYKNDILEASKYINSGEATYVAGAMVIKYQNRISIIVNGFDHHMTRFAPNYFLYYAILTYYKDSFKYADLNGMTADLSQDNKYYGLNRFKLGFNPDVYEYIGEFDLPINMFAYQVLLRSGLLAKEFNK